MGKWATYSRRGGGSPTAAALIFITDASIDAAIHSTQTYSGPISAAAFDPTTFHSPGTGGEGVLCSQVAANKTDIEWDQDLAGATTLEYDGTVVGILTPQSIPFV